MIYKYIGHCLRTITGFYQRPYNKLWDEKLKWYLDGGEVLPELNTISSGYLTSTITKEGKTITVWTGNKYYSYGNLYQEGMEEYRPSFETMLQLDERVSAWIAVVEADKDRKTKQAYEEL